jgi:serine-type D-Ala-D-Ala carboxypeptidase (penicillin-binding protein 5/6)
MQITAALAAGLAPLMVLTSAPTAELMAPDAGRWVPVRLVPAQPPVRVGGADLVTVGTGYQWWATDLDTRRPIGSIAKVMTALVVLNAGHLDRRIRVSRAAVRYVSRDGASSAGLIAGDVLTARQLLEAMLLPSGCDAAYLLATAYGPGRGAFIRKMNATAEAIGLTSTHFTSFDGMPYPTERSTYSTPADLIRLGELVMRYPIFRRIVGQRRYYLTEASAHHSYLWFTTNGLIGSYKGALGIKTGDTKAAGNCLLFEAKRDGRTLLGVVLHAAPTSNPGSAIVAARQLLNWGFRLIGGMADEATQTPATPEDSIARGS